MSKALAVAVLAAVLAVPLAGCGGSHADAAACRSAMSKNFALAVVNSSGPPQGEPAACKGLSSAQLQKLAGQAIGQVFAAGGGASPAAPPSPSSSAADSAACRDLAAWENGGRDADALAQNAHLNAEFSALPGKTGRDFAAWMENITQDNGSNGTALANRVVSDCAAAGVPDVLGG